MKGNPANFSRLVSLARRLRPRGWKPLSLHSRLPGLQREFCAAGREWELQMNPSVNPSTAMLSLWICPRRVLEPREWKKLDRGAFCTRLDRKMQSLRFLKVFGLSSGGRILFYKRITSVSQVTANWRNIARIRFDSLSRQRVPDSPPVRSPLPPVGDRPRERLLWELVRRGRSPHLSIGRTLKEKVSGRLWTVHLGVYWNLHPRSVSPPSELWCSVMVWPPSGLTPKDQAGLQRRGFYSRISRSLKRRGFRGKWHDDRGGFADFGKNHLRWADIVPLCTELQTWTLKKALVEVPKGTTEKLEPFVYSRR